MADELTLHDLTSRGHSYRGFDPGDVREVMANQSIEEGRRALDFIESGRFDPFLAATSEFFFKLDNDEQETFTQRNPDVVQWMSVWNESEEFNPYEDWYAFASSILTADRDGRTEPPMPFDRREVPDDRTLEADMRQRRRSYRNWTPDEFFEVAVGESVDPGEVVSLTDVAADKLTGRELLQRVEAGRFEPMLREGYNVFIRLDVDERKMFARRNPGLTEWLSAWGFLEDLIHGEEMRVDFPLVERRKGREGRIGAPRRFSDKELLDDLRDVADGSSLSKREYDERGITSSMTIRRRFGSWNEGLEEAGLEAQPPGGPTGRRISNEDIIADIIAGRDALDTWPNSADYEDFGSYSLKLVIDRFGSWGDAIEAAKEQASGTPFSPQFTGPDVGLLEQHVRDQRYERLQAGDDYTLPSRRNNDPCARLPAVIRDVVETWGRDPCRINMGECAIFADAVADRVDGVHIVDNVEWAAQGPFDVAFEHAFIECGGRYYDSETPEGVDDWRDLPFFQRNFMAADLDDAFVMLSGDSGQVVEPGVWMPDE